MNYNLKELREKLVEHISKLGIDERFLENPAFASAISEIDSLIGQMNANEQENMIPVKEENGSISFGYISVTGNKYSYNIACTSPEKFSCIKIEEKKPYISTNGQTTNVKEVTEKVTTIDESGFVTSTANGSIIDNINCEIGKCNNTTWSEKKQYNTKGIMTKKEYKGFPKGELSESFERTGINSILYIPRQAFVPGTFNTNYEKRTLLMRDKLDTARYIAEDKAKGTNYSATVPLNQEHGLREMRTNYLYEQNIVIPPLSQDEIEQMIQRESNPKVAEGLREYAVGRNTYLYNSAEDSNFVCEDVLQSQGIQR